MSITPDALIRSGYDARRADRLEDAERLFSEAVDLARDLADRAPLARALTGMGQIERDLHNDSAALAHYHEAAEIYRALPSPLALAHTIRHIADILRHDGSFDAARPYYEEALKIYREQPDTPPLDLANAIRGFALLRTHAGETEAAKSLWQEARGLYESVHVEVAVRESEAQIARLTRSA
jgi:tetratricopeptide (TPR) repeat protein